MYVKLKIKTSLMQQAYMRMNSSKRNSFKKLPGFTVKLQGHLNKSF